MNNWKQNFKHCIEITVRYEDLDTLKHVNNKAYLSYLEEARITYFRDVLLFDVETLDFRAVVVHTEIDYIVPIKYADKVRLYTRCTRIGNKSFDMQTFVSKQTKNEEIIAAKALVTLVSYNVETEQAIENPKDRIDIIRQYDNL